MPSGATGTTHATSRITAGCDLSVTAERIPTGGITAQRVAPGTGEIAAMHGGATGCGIGSATETAGNAAARNIAADRITRCGTTNATAGGSACCTTGDRGSAIRYTISALRCPGVTARSTASAGTAHYHTGDRAAAVSAGCPREYRSGYRGHTLRAPPTTVTGSSTTRASHSTGSTSAACSAVTPGGDTAEGDSATTANSGSAARVPAGRRATRTTG